MGIPDHLVCLLRNLYAGQEATVRTGHGAADWFQSGKEYVKAIYPITKKKKEYWSGLPFPFPEYLSDPEIEPVSPAWQADS